jgi:predicted acylesterase/phospholipase RssA
MKKTLKLGFAMGGGVSLGTFSGAGLSEVIKQALLHGGYYDAENNFHAYDEVVVDLFAGASAGSMALAVMLRGMAYQTTEERAVAETKLIKEIGETVWGSFSRKKQLQLVVAQVVQDLQEKVWIKEINIEKLLGSTAQDKLELSYEAGIVRRGALEEVAKKFFNLDEAYANGFTKREILADRVLFASTLSNLTGLKFDSRDGGPANPNHIGAEDAFTSDVHREVRVFDLFFTPQDPTGIPRNHSEFPPHWIRYHDGKKIPGCIGNLRQKSAWSRMASTSIACGAFPFAFTPVVLERFKFEYNSEWPGALTDNVCKLATNYVEPVVPETYYPSYPFTYVDGGTFNNEPVREAFRLASFLDSEEDPDEFDRVIVFVDPNVASQPVNFRVPVHKEYTVKSPRMVLGGLDGHDLERKTTLDRLLPHVGTLLKTLIDQGRINENDKIFSMLKIFDEKKEYYDLFSELIDKVAVNDRLLISIKYTLKKLIEHGTVNILLPAGSITLTGELIRTIKENKIQFAQLTLDDIKVFDEQGPENLRPEVKMPVLKALYMVFLDLLINLTGKSKESKIIAIAPVKWAMEDGKEVAKTISLPGGELEAFAGFTSETPNYYSADLAKYCAGQFMKKLNMLSPHYVAPQEPVWDAAKKEKYRSDFKSKLWLMNNRIDSLIQKASVVDIFPGLDKLILSRLSALVKDALAEVEFEDDPADSYLFYIKVPNKNFEIDGKKQLNDASAVLIGSQFYLITELYYHWNRKENERWEGIHVQENCLVIDTKGYTPIDDRSFCSIQLPQKFQAEVAKLMPNPIFELPVLTERDKGRQIKSNEWQIKPGVTSLDKSLL